VDINKELSCLIGQKLKDAGRAGDMLWLAFGNEIEVADYRGKQRFVNRYALHVQCPWRITDGQHIVVASGDFYIPGKGVTEAEFDRLDDTFGCSRFDEAIGYLRTLLETDDIAVIETFTDSYGGLQMLLSKRLKLEIFPHRSIKKEFWRFFEHGSDKKHIVVFDE
jgi:hypothetical protein